jgi:thioredoxin-like negative regulator of GroEL
LIKNGAEVDRMVGAVPFERLRGWVEPHLAPTRETA